MKRVLFFLMLIIVISMFSCTQGKYRTVMKTDNNGYKYETVTNDPLQARMYSLSNGLKVYLTVNKDEPRIQTIIGIRAGSASDPLETTGLAHYFEHLMFKGTHKIGTINWEEEEPLLKEISDLFEQHRATTDTAAKLAIYRKIDSLSVIAAKYVATNEYDKLVSSIGAKGTNAFTDYDLTGYINDIPSNELEKWLKLESERFGQVVLRLFHTELETVYEEYNMYNDMDQTRAEEALMASIFPKHPYGRDVLGLPEHLKNPSMVNIYNFYNTFYVPNNMAIVLSGDFDPDETIKLIDKYWGTKENKPLPEITQPKEDPITAPIIKEVSGPDAESVRLAYRFNGVNSEDEKYIRLIDQILSNSQAGLIDIDLNQQQKVLRSGSYSNFMRDYGLHEFYGNPREGQSLENVKDLLLGEIQKVKNGEFDDWMLQAVINDLRLSEIRQQENNMSRAFVLMSGFIDGTPRINQIKFLDDLEKISKEQVVQYSKDKFKDNYVVVYKRTGEKKDVKKVEKPPITAVPINREYQSEFYKEFSAISPEEIKPVFVDFEKEIGRDKITDGVDYFYMKNNTNELFSLNYIIDMGKNHDLNLPIAVNYLPYLGTDKYTPAQLRQEFFKLGISMGVSTGADRSYIYISGLEKSFEKGIELLEHVLSNAKADQEAYDEYVKGILKKRSDNKLNKNAILWNAMFNYGKYGTKSPTTDILTEEQLKSLNPENLTKMIKEMYSYKHKVFYYGQNDMAASKAIIEKFHKMPAELKDYPSPTQYTELDSDKNKVYFVDYDMTQANIVFLSKDQLFSKDLLPPARLFNEYFGGGMASIVLQEIRESRGLAYSAFAAYAQPDRPFKHNFTYAFVGTQADKLKIATDAMLAMMNQMPRAEKQFDLAKETIVKQINSERIIKEDIFWTYLSLLDLGINYDNRKDVYNNIPAMSLDDLNKFFDEHIQGKKYTFLVLGKKGSVDMNVLGQIGEVKELTLKEIFNY
ncbi:MAG: insulinase family protein [Bacteroidetes bacterium]|nr:insulinase family protein [Bacteroidota bacterium]